MIMLGFSVASFGYFVHFCFIRRIIINETGVEYKSLIKRYKMSWDEIKVVHITYFPFRGRGPLMISFTDGTVDSSFHTVTGASCIIVQHRKAVTAEVLKYWPEAELLGLHWERNPEK